MLKFGVNVADSLSHVFCCGGVVLTGFGRFRVVSLVWVLVVGVVVLAPGGVW